MWARLGFDLSRPWRLIAMSRPFAAIEFGCDRKHLAAEIGLIAVLHSASRAAPPVASGVLLRRRPGAEIPKPSAIHDLPLAQDRL